MQGLAVNFENIHIGEKFTHDQAYGLIYVKTGPNCANGLDAPKWMPTVKINPKEIVLSLAHSIFA